MPSKPGLSVVTSTSQEANASATPATPSHVWCTHLVSVAMCALSARCSAGHTKMHDASACTLGAMHEQPNRAHDAVGHKDISACHALPLPVLMFVLVSNTTMCLLTTVVPVRQAPVGPRAHLATIKAKQKQPLSSSSWGTPAYICTDKYLHEW